MIRADAHQAKSIRLKDGRQVRVRPLVPEDAERFYWFLGGISEDDRRYLRIDVRDRDLVIERVRRPVSERELRLVAETDEEIVAEASLEAHERGWEGHLGEMRLLVAPHYRGNGLGRALAREIYLQAFQLGLSTLVARVMRPQTGARRILRHFGFTEQALLPDHVRDQDGHPQDLMMMTLDLEAVRQDLDQHTSFGDFHVYR